MSRSNAFDESVKPTLTCRKPSSKSTGNYKMFLRIYQSKGEGRRVQGSRFIWI